MICEDPWRQYDGILYSVLNNTKKGACNKTLVILSVTYTTKSISHEKLEVENIGDGYRYHFQCENSTLVSADKYKFSISLR